MMFTITITFLMYVSASFAEIEYMMLSVYKAVIGADIALFRGTNYGGAISLDEAKLTEYLEDNMVDKGGLVTGYEYLP